MFIVVLTESVTMILLQLKEIQMLIQLPQLCPEGFKQISSPSIYQLSSFPPHESRRNDLHYLPVYQKIYFQSILN